MAEGGIDTDSDFPWMDPEMQARLLPTDSTGFSFGGSIRPESSLLIFIKKRAPRNYVGFVDTISMAPTPSLQNRGVKVFNGLVNSPVSSRSEFLQGQMGEQLKFLSHSKHGPLAQQLLLTETLPLHDYELNLSNIADCLSADSGAVRRDAAARLERLILVTSHKVIQAFQTQLLAVAQKTHDVISDDTNDDMAEDKDHLRNCAHLHLLAVSALFSRPKHRPLLSECRPFMSWPKLNKKQTGYDLRQEVLKVLHAFYECLERHLKDRKSKMAAIPITDLKKFIKADVCDQMSSLFLILNQVAEEAEEYNEKTLKLLALLKELCDVTARDSKKLRPEVKAGIVALLMRSLIVLLNSKFGKVRQEIGEQSYNHPVKVAELLTSVARTISTQHSLQEFLPDLSTIAYHESPEVRHIMTELLDSLHRPPLHRAMDYLQWSLGVADFHMDPPSSPPEETCSWHTLTGRFGRRLADCHVLVHAGQCKAKRSSSSECVDHPRGGPCGGRGGDNNDDDDGDEWELQRHNMEMLLKLASSCTTYHNPLVQLMAFQNSPFLFYATQRVKGHRLLEHLINHRAADRWLSTSVLARVMHDVISGLEFLANRNIASRQITAYYMRVDGRSRRGGVASEKVDILSMDDFSIKLTSLGLAHQFRHEEDRRTTVRKVEKQGPIPLLWTPVEALLRGEYSELSMVYSAGCLMYELWTHGCQPFTTYQKATADTVRMRLLSPDTVMLIWWPCIPEDVFGIMTECTAAEPLSRPSLASLKQKFMEMHTRRNNNAGEEEAVSVGGKEQNYPSFSDDQVKRRHLPELGIPPDVRQVIEEIQKNRNDSYRNMRRSRWEVYAENPPEGALRELNSPYWVQFAYMEHFTSVRERLPPSFAQKELPLLENMTVTKRDYLPGVTEWLLDKQSQPTLEEESRDHVVHERRYRPSWTLQDAACKGMLSTSESGYVSMAMERYVHVLLSLARSLHKLHVAGWMHRDVRACNVLVDCRTGEATLARIGRMCPVKTPPGSVVAEPFEDSWRWLGPEVLSEGTYTRENDVFMFGTVVWETFWCREITEKNPTATEMNFLPFANQPRDNILSLVRQKKSLPKPQACPDWLYQLSVNCRHPDPALRPLTGDILLTLEGELIQGPDPSRAFLVHPKLLGAVSDRCSATGMEVPELPARFQSKHAAPFPPHRDSGIDDCFDETARNRPINLGSIILDPKNIIYEEVHETSTSERDGGNDPAPLPHQRTERVDYLTPIFDEVRSATEAPAETATMLSERMAGGQRRSSDTDMFYRPPILPPRDSGDRLEPTDRSFSVSELSSTAAREEDARLGLNFQPSVATVPHGVRVFREIRGYPSGRGLPNVPTEDDIDGEDVLRRARRGDNKQYTESVYEEIK